MRRSALSCVFQYGWQRALLVIGQFWVRRAEPMVPGGLNGRKRREQRRAGFFVSFVSFWEFGDASHRWAPVLRSGPSRGWTDFFSWLSHVPGVSSQRSGLSLR